MIVFLQCGCECQKVNFRNVKEFQIKINDILYDEENTQELKRFRRLINNVTSLKSIEKVLSTAKYRVFML